VISYYRTTQEGQQTSIGGFRSVKFAVKGLKTLNPLYTNINPLERAALMF
jgi:hypothetical protein